LKGLGSVTDSGAGVDYGLGDDELNGYLGEDEMAGYLGDDDLSGDEFDGMGEYTEEAQQVM
jgi:hypothetical protein